MNQNTMRKRPTVLMVCLGNICRSPLAEAALRQATEKLGVEVYVDSAGAGDWHVGNAPDKRACEVALNMGGIDIRKMRARQIVESDFFKFDYILAMDTSNLRFLQSMTPEGSFAKLSLLLDYTPGAKGRSVADPYYGTSTDFESCWRQVQAAAEHFIKRLKP